MSDCYDTDYQLGWNTASKGIVLSTQARRSEAFWEGYEDYCVQSETYEGIMAS